MQNFVVKNTLNKTVKNPLVGKNANIKHIKAITLKSMFITFQTLEFLIALVKALLVL